MLDMTGIEVLGISLLVLAIAGLIIWSMVKHSKKQKVMKSLLLNIGFAPCDEEKKALAEKVTFIENNSEYTYSVRKPMEVSQGNTHVYFYIKERRRSGDLDVSEEFLFTVERNKKLPFTIYLKPTSLAEGIGTKLIRSVVTMGWDSQSDDLVKIDLPEDLQSSNILGVMGPKNCSFYDLFDSNALSLLLRGADNDVFIMHYRDNLCSIESPLALQIKNHENIWSYIQLIIRQGL